MSCYLFDASKRKGIKPVVDGVVQETPKEIIKPITHVIRKGETLSSIAGKYKDITYQDIAKANGIHNPNNIYAGQRITIPNQPKTPTPPPNKPTHKPLADSTSIGGSKGSGCECPPAKWMRIAKGEIGVKEINGPKSNPKILEYDHAAKFHARDDSGSKNAWCGSFVAWVMKKSGYTPINHAMGAKRWKNFGKKAKKPIYGAIGIKSRTGGGHVSFVVGQSADGKYLYMLGGNQHDSVNISRYPRSVWSDFRVPKDYDDTKCKLPIYDGNAQKGGKES